MSYFAPKQDEVGTVKDFGQAAVPGGWILCDGAAVSRSTFAALFAAIGVVWGVGDGSTTFNVPDCRGRSRVGTGQGAGLTNRALAASGGAETHPLVTAELASHPHNEVSTDGSSVMTAGGGASTQGNLADVTFGNGGVRQTATAGSGTAHNTMHPFKACAVGIRA